MAIIQKISCSKDEYAALPTLDSIVIEVKMSVNDEEFVNAFVIDNFRGLDSREIGVLIEKEMLMLARMNASVFNRQDLTGKVQ